MDKETVAVSILEGIRKIAIRHVFITGTPGAGKTTLSESMAKERGLPVLHGDMLPAMEGSRFAGTDSLRRKLKRLRKPYIVEGAQALGLNREDLEGHEVMVLDPGRKVLVERLMNRGWTDSAGKQWKGELSRQKAHALVSHFQGIVKDFNRRRRVQ